MYALAEGERALAAVDLVPGLALAEVRDRLRQFLRLEETGQRGLAFYLTEVADRRLHQSGAYSSVSQYAEAQLGLDRRRTSELVSVGRKLLTLPDIDRAFCEQRIGWSKILLLARVAVPEHQRAWLERALALDAKELAEVGRRAREGGPPPSGSEKGLPEIRFPFRCSLPALTHQMMELAKQKLTAERGEAVGDAECLGVMADLFLSLEEDGSVPGRTRVSSSLYRIVLRPGEDAATTLVMDGEEGSVPVDARALLCDAETVSHTCDDDCGHEVDEKGIDRKTPARLRRSVLARDGSRCRCCGSRQQLMVHHIRYRSSGGRTKAWNLITLCGRCHALVHEDLLVLEGERADQIRFVNREGGPLHDPGGLSQPTAPMQLAPPREPAIAAQQRPAPVAFDELPDAVDAAWWRRHGHLIRFRSDRGLEFRPGRPLPADEAQRRLPTRPEAGDPLACLVGQDALIRRLRATAEGRRSRGRPFPHTLFVGPPGTGKTSLARGVAAAFGTRLHATSGPLLKDTQALLRMLANLEAGEMLFVDEIHDVPRTVLEALYEGMADGHLDLTLHAGPQVRSLRVTLPPFTLLAATTEDGDLPKPLRSRFGILEEIGLYEDAALGTLAVAAARSQGYELEPDAATELARHARGTPREVLRLLEHVLDAASRRQVVRIDAGRVRGVLADLGYDDAGLKPREQRYLGLLRSSPVPIPLARLARMLGASARTLVEHVEPHLFRQGLVQMTARGRTAVTVPQNRVPQNRVPQNRVPQYREMRALGAR